MGCSVSEFTLEETVLPPSPVACDVESSHISCHLNSSSLASRAPSADVRGLTL